ncbi:NAD(P)H-dependent oxidoreductase [Candidatus Poribacteria bacterium]|jgi:NAD(P)H-dependent FMN reductase|nr:NAD(P)H-dependent oxidoreductase [Candidatus Poribacteria bacterium]MBT5536539.1 NAD(P)H-dependent oxidoreductase [Candidatus Poribacteria bacterium]MBT5712950.1 NAD(P)H-dependent oxidoreductase [Candidatus Poribacteria bacterium]MBT7100353.1 NAD(P)H-dependent oxidoreductase [Candidatus Poribacteria bacterium]MBT7808467.1 NAD(P)H-dependent oxidoreductase [Candidatus Poribacteria bacterium]
MNVAVVSCSLRSTPRSYVLACDVADRLRELGAEVAFHDLREYDLDLRGTPGAPDSHGANEIRASLKQANAILVAAPVYNFDVNAAAKNLVELTGGAWEDKVVGFLCAAGGRASYMSVMGLANSLMLDFRCIVIPRFVYATGDDFENDGTEEMRVGSAGIEERIRELAQAAMRIGGALASTA